MVSDSGTEFICGGICYRIAHRHYDIYRYRLRCQWLSEHGNGDHNGWGIPIDLPDGYIVALFSVCGKYVIHSGIDRKRSESPG